MKNYKTQANNIRRQIIEIGYGMGITGMHFGPTLSLVEIMIALYETMKYDSSKPDWNSRDRLILSKGHGVLAQYAVMKQYGFLKNIDLKTFKNDFGILSAHPSRHVDIGIDYSTGSLGHGLSLGLGSALALRKAGSSSKVYVVLGDGECDEGSVWEAIMAANKYQTSNLIAVIDKNELQYDGPTHDVLDLDPLDDKFRSFGWIAINADGHNVNALEKALTTDHDGKPLAIIAHTIKGKGISFMENNPSWHNKVLNKEQYEKALKELEGTASCN